MHEANSISTRETRPDHNTGNFIPYSFRKAYGGSLLCRLVVRTPIFVV